MVFNWFRRQFDDRSENSQVDQTETISEPSEANQAESEPSEPEAAATATEEVAEDYLNWAKAAYQNIQKRQQVEPEAAPDEVAIEEPATEEPAAAEEFVAEAPEEFATEKPVAEELEVPEVAETLEEATAEDPIAEPAIAPTAAELTAEVSESTPTEQPETPEEAIAEPIAALASEKIEAPAIASETTPVEPLAIETSEVAPAAPTETSESTEAAPLPFWAQAETDRQARLERLKATAIEEPEPEVAQPSATVQEAVPEIAFDEGFLWSAEVLAAQGRRPDQISIEEITWLKRLRQGLDKTRRSLVNQLKAIVGQGPLNQDAVEEIEALLLQADVGVAATDRIIDSLQKKLREEALPPDQAIAYLKSILRDMLDRPLGKSYNPTFAPEKDTLNIWLITGVNGAGKTTTIGKLAHLAQKSEYNCLIAAADTFRAAAVEQVKVWGQRSGVEVISNPGQNTDPAAVVFDAIGSAQSRGTELLLVDTAGRLQNKKNLMDELSKVRRIIDKKAGDAKIESLLVLDATLGQNGLRQAEVFLEAAQLSGVVLTKLDGTAKGGIALAVVQQLGLPIRFIGAGEGIEDLRPFSSYEFVEALLAG
ncbi:signal recognition particle-docking protein FtsY [Trichocoleus sp. FACHB-262]|uniref:signal recognition particle-docking protein FtsY n=1 Tax=Trichocoleus sp. FACHB-262 TaxID=2692869 RepID=UPI001686562C|nr:signal recognition particle-docking protein FtsY [Trichocoleus sp. FACHB-262]MBD2122427.1 signal recognition particle-docking protein FtsY [Trichocoleus sp. FACHB-262]